jgi:hypothetical protein
MSNKGEWSDEEVEQIRYVVQSDLPAHLGKDTFHESDRWEILGVERDLSNRSLVNLALRRISDNKRLTLSLLAARPDDDSWSPNGSSLTDQVFDLSILLMEFCGIIGIDDFQDGESIDLGIGCDIYLWKPPNWTA